jgi:hypothetical protein
LIYFLKGTPNLQKIFTCRRIFVLLKAKNLFETFSHILNETSFTPRPAKCWSEMKPLTYDLGYDNVLLGQGYRILHAAVIDEYGAMVELWLTGETK